MMRELKKQFYAESYSNLWMGSAAFLCSSCTSHACCCNQRELTLPTGAEKLPQRSSEPRLSLLHCYSSIDTHKRTW
jgi:hypothetical protein